MSSYVVATAYGGPEVLSHVTEPTRAPGPGEVVLDVRAAGVNPADLKSYNGAFGSDPGKLPIRLGYEAAGVISALGPDGTGGLAVGDEVIGYRVTGGYADQMVVPAAAVVPKPANMTWEQAAGLLLTGATAVHALTATGVGAGDTVLVHAAAGGVGLMAVQIAVARGARVIGTASSGSHEVLRELGAEPVSYGAGLADRIRALVPAGPDAAIDAVGTDEAVDVSVELIADRNRIATIAAFRRGAELGIKVLGGGPGADPGTAIRDAARLELAQQVTTGTLRVIVAHSYSMADVADAHRALQGGHSTGKIVLIP